MASLRPPFASVVIARFGLAEGVEIHIARVKTTELDRCARRKQVPERGVPAHLRWGRRRAVVDGAEQPHLAGLRRPAAGVAPRTA
jgi:hypothetical protein